jgi:hypothetical protein
VKVLGKCVAMTFAFISEFQFVSDQIIFNGTSGFNF